MQLRLKFDFKSFTVYLKLKLLYNKVTFNFLFNII